MRAAARPARRRTPASVASRTPGDDTSSATQPRQSTVMLLSRPDRQQDASCAAHLILDWRASKDDISADRERSLAAIMVFSRAGLPLSAEHIIAWYG